MLVVHVHVYVRAEFVEAFREARLENARHSVREAGIARFDVIQQPDDIRASSWSRSRMQ
jgi:autoinducer 2-degrading protein